MDWQILADGGVVGLAIGGLVPYLIPELEQPVKRSLRLRIAVLLFFGVVGIGVVECNRLERGKFEKRIGGLQEQLNRTPQLVAEYIKNTSPPPSLAVVAPLPCKVTPPSPVIKPTPKEKLAKLAESATELSANILAFLERQGSPPFAQLNNETWSDYIARINAWYSHVLAEYDRQFGADVIAVSRQLLKDGLVKEDFVFLAEHPTNPNRN